MPPQAQHLHALDRANAVRSARATILRPLRRGETRIGDVDLDDPSIQGMLVIDFLANLRYRRHAAGTSVQTFKAPARKAARRVLKRFGSYPRMRVGHLTPARKRELVALLEATVPAQAVRR